MRNFLPFRRAEREEFALLLCLESAKPIRYALSEVDRAIQTFIVAAESLSGCVQQLPAGKRQAGSSGQGVFEVFPSLRFLWWNGPIMALSGYEERSCPR
mgnify:CR=1 FL=1